MSKVEGRKAGSWRFGKCEGWKLEGWKLERVKVWKAGGMEIGKC